MATRPSIGRTAPLFDLPGRDGEWSLAQQRGSAVVLYFYPRDDTPGCTDESRQFAASHAQFAEAGSVIAGISPDPLKSHERFRKKFDLPFELLADTEKKVCALYDVIQEKSMYGKKYMGVERSTFVIDAEGVLRNEWRKVKVPGHAEAVLAAVRAL